MCKMSRERKAYSIAIDEATREVSYLYPEGTDPNIVNRKVFEKARENYFQMMTPPKSHVSNRQIMDKLDRIEQILGHKNE